MAFELPAEENRIERHLVRFDFGDAEFVEERLALFAEAFDECLVGRLAAEDAARIAVNVREDEVDVVLIKRIETRAVLKDPADFAVIALHMRLLRRAVGVAIEDADAARDLQRRVVDRIGAVFLDHLGVGEFGSVVGENDMEELPEKLRSCDFPQVVEDAGACLRTLVVAQKSEHDTAGQIDREEHFAADLSDDRVELGVFLDVVCLAEHDELPVGASDAAFRVCLRLLRFLLLPAAARLGKVAADDVEEPATDVVVNRAFLDASEDLRVVADDVPDRLPLEDAGRENLVHLLDPFVGRMDSALRIVKGAGVVRLRAVGRIDTLHHRTGREVLAAVADVRLVGEFLAFAFDEVRADFEAMRRAVERALRVTSVAFDTRTVIEQRTDAVRAPVVAIRLDGAVDEFPQNRRFFPS